MQNSIDMQKRIQCEKSPDKKHHYKAANFLHAVHIENGYHEDLVCVFCGKNKCNTVIFPEINPLEYPTDEDLENKYNNIERFERSG